MTDLKHLQNVLIDMARDIDELCSEYQIEYYLLGGSAIGAVRHKGFIPWDDDLDFIMDNVNYNRFISVCRKHLDTNKYYLQEAYRDWPMPFTKIKLIGTRFDEPSGYARIPEQRGIFIDIFKLENAPASSIGQLWQYFCGKYLLSYCLAERGYPDASFVQKCMMFCSIPLKNRFLRRFFRKQVEKWNDKDTEYCCFLSGRYRYRSSFYHRSLFCNPIRVQFENYELPIPQQYDIWLTQIFGDYMTPPPADQQVGLHLVNVDFGNY